MSEASQQLILEVEDSQDRVSELLEQLFDVARPGAVFGEPVTVEGTTIITASEVAVGLGLGFGSGGGTAPAAVESEKAAGEEEEVAPIGFGGGGGGGGGANGRPVAAIIVSSEGVRVEPIVDVTKLGLAFFTMLGSIFLMGSRMRRAAGGK